MKKKVYILLLCVLTAFALMSGGYGFWEKKLTIKGSITVVDPIIEAESDMPAGMGSASFTASPSSGSCDSGGGEESSTSNGSSEGSTAAGSENPGGSQESSSSGSDTGGTGDSNAE